MTGSTVFNNDIVEPNEVPWNVLGISSSLAKIKTTKMFRKQCYFVILTSCSPQLQLSSLTKKNVPFKTRFYPFLKTVNKPADLNPHCFPNVSL